MRVSYIGSREEESGFMVGSHLMDKPIFNINEEAVEDGHFVTRSKPHQGIRLVYLPCKEDDLEFKITDSYITVPET